MFALAPLISLFVGSGFPVLRACCGVLRDRLAPAACPHLWRWLKSTLRKDQRLSAAFAGPMTVAGARCLGELPLADARRCLVGAIHGDNMPVVVWLMTAHKITLRPFQVERLTRYACGWGGLSAVKWLTSLAAHPNPAMLVWVACYGDHLAVARWIYAHYALDMSELLCIDLGGLWKQGGLNCIAWLLDFIKVPYGPHAGDLCDIYGSGRLRVAKWYVDRYGATASELLSTEWGPLARACFGGHLDLVAWTVRRFDLDARQMAVAWFQTSKRGCVASTRITDWMMSFFGEHAAIDAIMVTPGVVGMHGWVREKYPRQVADWELRSDWLDWARVDGADDVD
jgi:hypothetical protein